MTEEENQVDINNEKYAKYKEMFDKHKNEDGMLSEEGVNEILNECGRKTTLKESEELIKKINRNTGTTSVTFDNFIKLMNSSDVDNLIEKENKPKTLTNCQFYFFMILLLVTGSINTIVNKLQQSTSPLGSDFKGHQKFLTFCMFIGEFLCLLFYWLKEGRFKKKKSSEELIENVEKEEEKKKKNPKIWYFLFPALSDIMGSTISSIGLTFLPSSIYQMFRGAIIIFTCTASIIFLKNKYYRHHFFGIFVVIIGLCIVGINAILNSNGVSGENPGFGIFLVVLSQLFSCSLLITEEKLLKGYETPALKAVGLEGMWGVLVYLFLLFIFYFIRCEEWTEFLKEGVCIKDDNKTIRFENALFALKQIFCDDNEIRIKFYLPLYILSIAFFNFSGLSISKYASATARTICDTLRTIVVWVFFLMPFVPENTKETFHLLQLLGFLVLVLGAFIYNEIIVIPFFGCADNTKEAIKKREKLETEKEDKTKETPNELENIKKEN